VSLTAAQRQQMEDRVADVRRAFAKARPAVYEAASGFFASDAAKAVKKQLDDQGVRSETWATKQRAEVERGAAELKWWLDAGLLYARYAASTVGDAVNATLWTVVANTATQTAVDVKEGAAVAINPLRWGVGTQLLAGVVVLLVGGYLVVRLREAAP
jgi:hypothetical protein